MKLFKKLMGVAIAVGLMGSALGKSQAAPTGGITYPTNGSTLTAWTSVTGTCVPDSSLTIATARVQLRRNSDNKYWKNSTDTWEVAANNWIVASISGNTWSISAADLPSGANLSYANYLLTLELTDSVGVHNATPYPKVYFDYAAVPVPQPVITASRATAGGILDYIYGTYSTAVGDPGIQRVNLVIRRTSDNYYLKQTISGGNYSYAFQAAPASIDAFLDTANKTYYLYWGISPPGAIVGLGLKTTITGYDTAGNPSNVIVLNYVA